MSASEPDCEARLQEFMTPSRDWEPLQSFPKKGADGQDAKVMVFRSPSKSYRVEVAPGAYGDGEPKPGFSLRTGSGERMKTLATQIAKAVAEGMLSLVNSAPTPSE
jgi:hypothetical protein